MNPTGAMLVADSSTVPTVHPMMTDGQTACGILPDRNDRIAYVASDLPTVSRPCRMCQAMLDLEGDDDQ